MCYRGTAGVVGAGGVGAHAHDFRHARISHAVGDLLVPWQYSFSTFVVRENRSGSHTYIHVSISSRSDIVRHSIGETLTTVYIEYFRDSIYIRLRALARIGGSSCPRCSDSVFRLTTIMRYTTNR